MTEWVVEETCRVIRESGHRIALNLSPDQTEGIETEFQRDELTGVGVVLGQGWLLGRPGPLPTSDEA